MGIASGGAVAVSVVLIAACGGGVEADAHLVGAGVFQGGSWRVAAELRGAEVCVRTTFTPPGAGATTTCFLDEEMTALTTHGEVRGAARPTILYGLTRADVASISIDTLEGGVQVPTVMVPALQATPNSKRGFAVAVPDSTVVLAFKALDGASNELERAP